MRPTLKDANDFIIKHKDDIKFFENLYNYIIFKKVEDDTYSLESSIAGEDNYQLCMIDNRRDTTTLFFHIEELKDDYLEAYNVIKYAKDTCINSVKPHDYKYKQVNSYRRLADSELSCEYNKGYELISVVFANNEYLYVFKNIK